MESQLNDGRLIVLQDNMSIVREFPAYIEIQTSSYCNCRCIVCPYSQNRTRITMGKMKMELWEKLVAELYLNRKRIVNIEPYLNNEPFLDKDIIKLLHMLKPIGAYIEMSTNLHHCTQEWIDEIISNELISEMRCSIFGLKDSTYKRIMGVDMRDVLLRLQYLSQKNREAGFPLKIQLTMIKDIPNSSNYELQYGKKIASEWNISFKAYPYLDRAENNEVTTEKRLSKKCGKVLGCKLGYLKDRLAIWHDGIVALCCQDWKREHIIGDLNEISIEELWHSPNIKMYRDDIYKGRNEVEELLCKKCALSIVEVEE